MRIGGKCIDENELENLLANVKKKKLAANDTLFAAYTAAAMLWFSRMNVDYAVIETGLGGRLDPTNSINPEVVILTSIDHDHTKLLGSRIAQIAKEKCGIIKHGVPVLSSKQHKEAHRVINLISDANANRSMYFAHI